MGLSDYSNGKNFLGLSNDKTTVPFIAHMDKEQGEF